VDHLDIPYEKGKSPIGVNKEEAYWSGSFFFSV
jgi:hypothetical protein